MKEIRWLRTRRGGWMPVDAATASPSDSIFDMTKHTSHWDTCPVADKFRSRRRNGEDDDG
jgi:hypothetical protein